MAVARNDTYSVDTGTTVGAGTFSYPTWRKSMLANTWTQVPVSVTLSSLNPALDPSINPNYPSNPEYYGNGWSSIFGAWNGGCYDKSRDEFMMPITGGHADYTGNDFLVLELRKNSARWVRRCKPSGWDGSVITLDQARLQPGSSGNTLVLASGTNAPLLYTGARDEPSNVNGFYVGMQIHVYGQAERNITAYDASTKTVTVDVAYSGSQAGKLYAISNGPMVHGLNAEKTGRYSDGRARPVHTYNIPVFADDAAWMPVAGASGLSWSATQSNTQGLKVDRLTGAHTFIPSANSTIAANGFGASTTFDPTRGAKGSIWYIGEGCTVLGRFDIATNTWTQSLSFTPRAGNQSICYLPGVDLILLTSSVGKWSIYDPTANTIQDITVTGTPAGSVTTFGAASLQYVSKDNSVYWWNNPTGFTNLINKLTVPNNPKLDTWTITQAPVSPSNSVTPSSAQVNGTFGRFQYSSFLDGFLLLNAVSDPVYFYARSTLQ